MSSLLTTLGIDRLSVDDRLQLLGEIWESISVETDQMPIDPALAAELDRRLEEHRINPDAVIPWEVVRAESEPQQVS